MDPLRAERRRRRADADAPSTDTTRRRRRRGEDESPRPLALAPTPRKDAPTQDPARQLDPTGLLSSLAAAPRPRLDPNAHQRALALLRDGLPRDHDAEEK